MQGGGEGHEVQVALAEAPEIRPKLHHKAASQQGIDIWEIRRAVNMKDLPSQDIDDWSFVFSRSRDR
jgi:hypothetical protein